MRIFFLSFLFPFILFDSQAAFTSFLYKVEVSTKKGVIKGYFQDTHNLYILNNFDSIVTSKDAKYFIRSNHSKPNDYLLLYPSKRDTLDLYEDMYRIDSLDANIFYKDKLIQIPEKDIKSIKIISQLETSAYQNTHITASSKDKDWLTQKCISIDTVIYNFNEYAFIYYFYKNKEQGKLNSEYERLISKLAPGEELSEEEQISWNNKLNKYTQSIENEKVIIISHWSD